MSDERQCQVQPCHRKYWALGFCGTHYSQFRKGKLAGYKAAPAPRKFRNKGHECAFQDCTRPAETLSLCNTHYQQNQMDVPLRPIRVSRAERGCRADGCNRPHEAHGYCNTHYAYEIGSGKLPAGARRPSRRNSGYMLIWCPTHPSAHKSGYAYEHIVVMGDALGRPLLPDETVHHINGIRDDNRLANLELWTSRHHKGQRVSDLITWAKELLERYEPDALA